MNLFIGLTIYAFLPLLLLIFAFTFSIPKGIISFQKLKEEKTSSAFTETIGWGIASFIFLSITYLIWIRLALIYEPQISPEIVKFVIGALLFLLTFTVLIPKLHNQYMRWKKTGNPTHFSLAIFLSFVSLLILSVPYLQVALSILRKIYVH